MSKAKTRITDKWASAPLLQQDRALRSTFPAKPLLCLPLPAQPPAPAAVNEPSSTGIGPGTRYMLSPAGWTQVLSLPLSLLSPHPLLLSGLGSTSSTQWKIHTANTFSQVKYEQRQEVSLIQFTFNYEQLRQSHLHSSEEPLHQHPGWSGKLILVNFWGYSCWCSLCYSLAPPYQGGSDHTYGSTVL